MSSRMPERAKMCDSVATAVRCALGVGSSVLGRSSSAHASSQRGLAEAAQLATDLASSEHALGRQVKANVHDRARQMSKGPSSKRTSGA
eukprot:6210832-Pleurochrysis_carterae.AAC.2